MLIGGATAEGTAMKVIASTLFKAAVLLAALLFNGAAPANAYPIWGGSHRPVSTRIWDSQREVWGGQREVWGGRREIWGGRRPTWDSQRKIWGGQREVWGGQRPTWDGPRANQAAGTIEGE
jgi:hypothetical protein